MRFRKSPTFMGKYLSLYIGGGDRVIGDEEILEGPQWNRYVDLGMLVQIPDAPQPAPKPVPKVEPKQVQKVEPKPQPKPAPPPPVVESKPEPPAPTVVPEAEPEEKPEEKEAPDGGVTKSSGGKWKRRRDK